MALELEMAPDIIYEILSRTSLTTLDASTRVCKPWKQLIYAPYFMPTYCDRTNNLSGYIIQTNLGHKFVTMVMCINERKIMRIYLGDDKMKLLATCNLGICVHVNNNDVYFACKPATRQLARLPNPKIEYETAGVGIMVLRSDPANLRYKIVRLSSLPYGSKAQYNFEIFDSEFWEWRSINGVNLSSTFTTEFIDKSNSSSAVSIGESLHWLTNENNILKIHVSEERFTKLPLPSKVVNGGCRCKRLFECEGNLGFSCIFDNKGAGTIELWVLDKNEWITRVSLDIASLEKVDFATHVEFYTSQVVFIKTLYQAFFYRLDQPRLMITRVMDLDYDFRYGHQVFNFRSDLEMVNLRGNQNNHPDEE